MDTAENKPKPTLETAVRVLEEAGFRVFGTTYRPEAALGKTTLDAVKDGGGVISLSITPRTEFGESALTWCLQ
jgi:hypothetical protein